MEKIVNQTIYKVINNESGLLTLEATIGVNGVKVVFRCFEIEWEKHFSSVQLRLKEIVLESANSI